MAAFHNNFDNVTRHTDLLLEWDPVNTTDYPLLIHARLMNKTSDHEVNSFDINITTGLEDNFFLWRDLPYPLPFLSTATYELHVRPQLEPGGMVSELDIVSSPLFAITEQEGDDSNRWPAANGTSNPPSKPTQPSHTSERPNSNTAIAAGLVVPLVVGISVFVFLWMQRRQKRIAEERRKEREGLVID
ncbi:hypothetical protein F5Y19DRAFT_470928 [Xylariaceae sp. FL1651]|nr:hypothetical protein F5Y19DRAFT_470928 [Xylariaceae sp. FL1651]